MRDSGIVRLDWASVPVHAPVASRSADQPRRPASNTSCASALASDGASQNRSPPPTRRPGSTRSEVDVSVWEIPVGRASTGTAPLAGLQQGRDTVPGVAALRAGAARRLRGMPLRVSDARRHGQPVRAAGQRPRTQKANHLESRAPPPGLAGTHAGPRGFVHGQHPLPGARGVVGRLRHSHGPAPPSPSRRRAAAGWCCRHTRRLTHASSIGVMPSQPTAVPGRAAPRVPCSGWSSGAYQPATVPARLMRFIQRDQSPPPACHVQRKGGVEGGTTRHRGRCRKVVRATPGYRLEQFALPHSGTTSSLTSACSSSPAATPAGCAARPAGRLPPAHLAAPRIICPACRAYSSRCPPVRRTPLLVQMARLPVPMPPSGMARWPNSAPSHSAARGNRPARSRRRAHAHASQIRPSGSGGRGARGPGRTTRSKRCRRAAADSRRRAANPPDVHPQVGAEVDRVEDMPAYTPNCCGLAAVQPVGRMTWCSRRRCGVETV